MEWEGTGAKALAPQPMLCSMTWRLSGVCHMSKDSTASVFLERTACCETMRLAVAARLSKAMPNTAQGHSWLPRQSFLH